MGKVIGSVESNCTPGEGRVFDYLNGIFEEDQQIWCYHEPFIGDTKPDFLLLKPDVGVVIFEVKDYHEANLATVTASGPWERTDKTMVENPFDQMYHYWQVIQGRVDQLPFGRRVIVHRVVALAEISKESPTGNWLRANHPAQVQVLYKEDLNGPRIFAKFIDILPRLIPPLNSSEMHLMRGNLVPETRISSLRQATIEEIIGNPDDLRLLDREQEILAKNLGEGHRIFYGTAGSGKTVLLIARARYLARRHPSWRMLLLVYNRNLARGLQFLLNPQQYTASIFINNFHRWAREVITASNKFRELYSAEQEKYTRDKDAFFNRIVPQILSEVVQAGLIPKYDAILIDEAQDWSETWFHPVVSLLNFETNSLLIASDGAQSLYPGRRLSWKAVGVQAQGRSKQLKKVYRNPKTIGEFAQTILSKELIDNLKADENFVAPGEFARQGGSAALQVFLTPKEEFQCILDQVREGQSKKWSILILFKYKLETMRSYSDPLIPLMESRHELWEPIEEYGNQGLQTYVGTIHGVKGLEADMVIIPELNKYNADVLNDRQLLYVGVTRAIRKLLLTTTRETKLTREFQENLP